MAQYIDLPKALDLSTSDSHDKEHDDAIQTILKDLDGYAWISGSGISNETATGSMADGYICFGTGATSIAGDNDFYWDRANNRLQLNAGTALSGPQDGNLLLTDDAGTDFGLIQLGGTTNAFPALKRSGTAIHARLADDSGYADFIAENITSGGLMASSSGVRAAAASAFYWNGRSSIYSTAEGDITITNSGATQGIKFDTSSDDSTLALRDESDGYAILKTGGFIGNMTEVSGASYQVLITDYVIACTRTITGTCAITLPEIPPPGTILHIKDAGGNANNNNITVSPKNGTERIDGAASYTISGAYNNLTLCGSGQEDWWIL